MSPVYTKAFQINSSFIVFYPGLCSKYLIDYANMFIIALKFFFLEHGFKFCRPKSSVLNTTATGE